MHNLLSNTLKFNAGQPRIVIAAHRQSIKWQIVVTDNGIGIDPQDATKIFAMPGLHDRSTYKGSGISLAICDALSSCTAEPLTR